MRIVIILFFSLICLLSGCSNYGYHPNYIISQEAPSPELLEEEIR